MDSFSFIDYSVEGRIAFITLNRPDKRNALNAAMVTELLSAFRKAGEDSGVKVIILKANGEAFSAGADLEYLEQLQNNSFEENLADSRHMMELFRQIYHHEKLVMAQIEGHAIAGGCGLAAVCDLSYSVRGVKFGYTEVKIGFVPAIVSVFLTRKIGEGKARELLLTGKLISAEEAAAIGMINGVMEKGEIQSMVRQLAEETANNTSGNSIKLTKQLIGGVQGRPLNEALELAISVNAETRATDDCKKGIRAFLRNEKISW